MAFSAKVIVLYKRSESLFIYVGGVPGVGKTSIIQEAEKLAQKKDILLKRIVGTGIMCELAGVSSVEELRKLPEEARRKLRPKMNARIYEEDQMDPSTIRVCDGHFCFFDVRGEKCGKRQIRSEDKEQMKAFVVVLANPQTILQRRIQDIAKRPDRQQSIEFIKKEQQLEIQIALTQAKELRIPIAFLVNGHKSSVVAEAGLLLSLIDQWLN